MNPIDKPQTREERAIVLDFLEHGYPFDQGSMKTPIVQALGLTHLTLLELIPKRSLHWRG